ncbi:unnamed protein product, partial [Closterium sp. NIES-64]
MPYPLQGMHGPTSGPSPPPPPLPGMLNQHGHPVMHVVPGPSGVPPHMLHMHAPQYQYPPSSPPMHIPAPPPPVAPAPLPPSAAPAPAFHGAHLMSLLTASASPPPPGAQPPPPPAQAHPPPSSASPAAPAAAENASAPVEAPACSSSAPAPPEPAAPPPLPSAPSAPPPSSLPPVLGALFGATGATAPQTPPREPAAPSAPPPPSATPPAAASALASAPPPSAPPSAPPLPAAAEHSEPPRSALPLQLRRSKRGVGKFLPGNAEVVSYRVDKRDPLEAGPPQLEVSPITVYGSEEVLAPGRQIAVNRRYISYALRNASIRVLNINTALRALFKGHKKVWRVGFVRGRRLLLRGKGVCLILFSSLLPPSSPLPPPRSPFPGLPPPMRPIAPCVQRITDMVFFAEDEHLMASASADGLVVVRRVEEGPGSDGKVAIGERVLAVLQLKGAWGDTAAPQLAWHPRQKDILIVACDRFVLFVSIAAAAAAAPTKPPSLSDPFVIDLTNEPAPPAAAAAPEAGGAAGVAAEARAIVEGVILLKGHSAPVPSLLPEPSACTLLPTPSLDGTVRVWSSTVCVSAMTPHASQPVFSALFLLPPSAPSNHALLLTGGPNNSELKLWASTSTSSSSSASPSSTSSVQQDNWRCIHTLQLLADAPPLKPTAAKSSGSSSSSSSSSVGVSGSSGVFCQLQVVQSLGLVLLTDALQKAIYAVSVRFDPASPTLSRFQSIAHFSVTMPILSFTAYLAAPNGDGAEEGAQGEGAGGGAGAGGEGKQGDGGRGESGSGGGGADGDGGGEGGGGGGGGGEGGGGKGGGWDGNDGSGEVELVQLFCMQTQAIQQYSLPVDMCLPPSSEDETPAITAAETLAPQAEAPPAAEPAAAEPAAASAAAEAAGKEGTGAEKAVVSGPVDVWGAGTVKEEKAEGKETGLGAAAEAEADGTAAVAGGGGGGTDGRPHLVTPQELLAMVMGMSGPSPAATATASPTTASATAPAAPSAAPLAAAPATAEGGAAVVAPGSLPADGAPSADGARALADGALAIADRLQAEAAEEKGAAESSVALKGVGGSEG